MGCDHRCRNREEWGATGRATDSRVHRVRCNSSSSSQRCYSKDEGWGGYFFKACDVEKGCPLSRTTLNLVAVFYTA